MIQENTDANWPMFTKLDEIKSEISTLSNRPIVVNVSGAINLSGRKLDDFFLEGLRTNREGLRTAVSKV